MTKTEFIKIFPSFRKSPDELVAGILSSARLQRFPKDTRIYSEGDDCSVIAFVVSGDIRVFKIGQTGREITLYEIGAGETCILNASCILSGASYPANAVAASEASMLLIPSGDFRRLVAGHEDMRDYVFTLLSQRLALVMALVEEIAFGRMDERLRGYLAERSDKGALETTHQKIASDLGTSREVVSRLLKDLERKGEVLLSRNSIRLVKT
jgi:CRP/FNR family transcriptional regulator